MAETTRRELLQAGSLLAAGLAVPGLFPTVASAAEGAHATALPAPDELVRLLGRATFGFGAAELEAARELGYEGWVEWQLDYEAIDDSALESVLIAGLPTLSMDHAAIVALAASPEGRAQVFQELLVATLARALYSPRQLYELMVELWSNHFSIYAVDGLNGILKAWEDRTVMRPLALGRFRELLHADAASPAMLVYLDNVSNVKNGPNENYARELMELHTLGVDGGYTETDVREAARVFTGWTVSRLNLEPIFVRSLHDTGAKTVLGIDFAAGGGREEGESLLEALAAHPSTARFIATKLVRRFVADTPPSSLVDAVAATYTSTMGDIRACLRTTLLSQELRSVADTKLKRPLEYMLSLLRATSAQMTASGWGVLFQVLQSLGQVPFTWPAPNGFPDVAGYWTSTSSLLTRFNIGLGLADGSLARAFQVDLAALVGAARTPAEIVDRLTERVIMRPLAGEHRSALIDFAADGGDDDVPLVGTALTRAVRGVLGLLLASGYFQYR